MENTSTLIAQWHRQARLAWPMFEVSLEHFTALAERVLEARGGDSTDVNADDLYLVSACSLGDAVALREFERRFEPVLRRVTQRAARGGLNADDFRQDLRLRLFVGTSGTPALATFSGTGTLGGWLKVVATRALVELLQRSGPDPRPQAAGVESVFDSLRASADDGEPEREAIRENLREPFRHAVQTAIEALEQSARVLLRQYYVHRVGIDGVARLLGVDRSNASRAVARARARFFSHLKKALAADLDASLSEASMLSIWRTLRSDADLSLQSFLG